MTIRISYRTPNDPQVRGLAIWAADSNDTIAAAAFLGPFYGPADAIYSADDTTLPGGFTRYYWARTVGPFGVLSDFSAGVFATHPYVADADFTGGTLPGSVTLTRAAGGAHYYDSGPDLTAAGANVARFDHDPATGAALGLLIESASTNQVANPRAEGYVAGSPGTLPTGWFVGTPSLTQTVVGGGTEDGHPYVDLRYAGTAVGTGGIGVLWTVASASAAAVSGETWVGSGAARIVAGTSAGITGATIRVEEISAANAALASSGSAISLAAASLGASRASHARILNQASTAKVRSSLLLANTNGAAIDITLRIAIPQTEKASAATSPILPPAASPAAQARAADAVSLAVANGTYDILTQDTAGGAFALAQVVSGGAYTITPRSGQRHVRRVRFWPAGQLTSGQRAALSVAA